LILYLLGVTLAAFVLPHAIKPYGVAALFALQLAILAFRGELGLGLLRIFSRLKFLFLFLVGVNGLLPGAVTNSYWAVPGIGLTVNVTGCLTGLLMSAQIALVVLTTYVVRTIGDEKSFINGLRSLRVAPLLAYSLDTTLAMLDGSLQRSGGGGGGGGGGGRGCGEGRGGGAGHGMTQSGWFARWLPWRKGAAAGGRGDRSSGAGGHDAAGGEGMMALFHALKHRDMTPLVEKINQGLDDAARHAQRLGLSESRAHDVGVIGGIAAVMMAFKMVKILPGMPVMQGAKTIFFIPLYILAADRTNSRWGGTISGGIMGFIAFLNGDSRYGIFEILKHLVPGLVIDLIWPLVRRLPLRISILIVVGLIAAVARTSTQFAMILALGSDNATLLVFPALKLVPNGIAGVLSALVSYPILKHLGSRAIAERAMQRPAMQVGTAAAAGPHDPAGGQRIDTALPEKVGPPVEADVGPDVAAGTGATEETDTTQRPDDASRTASSSIDA